MRVFTAQVGAGLLRTMAGTTLLEFTVGPSGGLRRSTGALAPATFEGLIAASGSGGLLLQLHTDLPGDQTIIARLFQAGEPRWKRRCPFPVTS